MKKIMQIMFLSCLKATEFIEKKLNYKLSFKEKIQLKIHTTMCKACSDYEKQSAAIEKMIANPDIQNIDKEELEILKKEIINKVSK